MASAEDAGASQGGIARPPRRDARFHGAGTSFAKSGENFESPKESLAAVAGGFADAVGDFANATGISKLFEKLFQSRRDVARCGGKIEKRREIFPIPARSSKVSRDL